MAVQASSPALNSCYLYISNVNIAGTVKEPLPHAMENVIEYIKQWMEVNEMCEATVYFEDDEVSNCILTMWTKFFLGRSAYPEDIWPEKIIKHGSRASFGVIRSL